MIRLSENFAELTPTELVANKYFNYLLDQGYGLRDAGFRTWSQFRTLSAEFIEWLIT